MNNEGHQPTIEELKAKAYQPMQDAMELHPFYRGKIETTLKWLRADFNDFAIWYTPGVSKPCLEIRDNPELVYDHTNKWNTVGRRFGRQPACSPGETSGPRRACQ